MENKQTAVEWFLKEIIKNARRNWKDTNVYELAEQAKQMEKEQNIGLLRWMNEISKSEPMRLETDFDDIVEQYYNETYNK